MIPCPRGSRSWVLLSWCYMRELTLPSVLAGRSVTRQMGRGTRDSAVFEAPAIC